MTPSAVFTSRVVSRVPPNVSGTGGVLSPSIICGGRDCGGTWVRGAYLAWEMNVDEHGKPRRILLRVRNPAIAIFMRLVLQRWSSIRILMISMKILTYMCIVMSLRVFCTFQEVKWRYTKITKDYVWAWRL